MSDRGGTVVTIVAVIGTTLFALAALVVILTLAHADTSRALGALWIGSFGSLDAIASSTLIRATPLILAGLAVALAFRAGMWNIGAEGQLIAGAAAAAAVALAFGGVGKIALLIALLMSAGAGAGWAAIAGELRRRFGVLEVISTIMLNFIALHAVGYLVRGPMQEPTHIYPQSATISAAVRLPTLPFLGVGNRLHWGFVIAIVAAVAQWWVLRATAAGFRVRLSGANPNAARVAGRIDVTRTTLRVFRASGALAGLAGGVQVMAVTYALYENLSPGYGYTAIAVALLARLNALSVIAAGVLFGALESGALAMQREAGVPAVVVTMVEAMVILAVIAAAALQSRAARSA